ncbi:MAG: NUDIX domain-containing protein [Nanoarchaeota archaeon]
MEAVSGIVNYKGKVLLGKKKKDSPKVLAGYWHFPGEAIENEESDEEALKRGFLEETGLEIRVGRFLASGITPTSKGEIRWYECFAYTYNVTPKSDLEELKWVDKNKVLKEHQETVKFWPKEIIDYFSG